MYIIYFFEEKGLLFVGEIIDGTGKNLTEDRKSEMLVANVKKMPLDKAIKDRQREADGHRVHRSRLPLLPPCSVIP